MRPRLLKPADLATIVERYHALLRLPMETGWNEREQAYADDIPDLLAHIAALTSSQPETPQSCPDNAKHSAPQT